MKIRPEDALEYHASAPAGKIAVTPTKPCRTQIDLSLAYTPGVAVPCLEIERDPSLAYRYTAKGNLVAVVTNGTAVLGLGNIGPLAGKPVMEGKGGAVQTLRRYRRVRYRTRHHRPGRGHPRLPDARAHLWRHQPRRHQGARMFCHRGRAAAHHEDPGVPRRSARDGDHLRRRPAERARNRGQENRRGEGGFQRRGGERAGLRHALRQPGRAPREHPDVRHQGRDLRRPHRRHEPLQGPLCGAYRTAAR